MATTIQVSEHMLLLLKKLKEETHASSYEEALEKSMKKWRINESMAGSLKEYLGKDSAKSLIKDLQNERRKSDRY